MASLTASHYMIVMIATLWWQIITFKSWFEIETYSLSIWDDILHTLMPTTLLVAATWLSIRKHQANSQVEETNEKGDIDIILSSLS